MTIFSLEKAQREIVLLQNFLQKKTLKSIYNTLSFQHQWLKAYSIFKPTFLQ